MRLECCIHSRHPGLHDPFLHVNGFEHAWEARAKDGMKVVTVVENDEGRIDALWLEVAEEGSGDGAHSLDIAACLAVEGERVKDVKE